MARRKKQASAQEAAVSSSDPGARKRKRKSKSKGTDVAAIKKRENTKAACEYRKQGYTFVEIAEELKVSTATAYRWVSEAIKEIPEEAAAEVRTMILGRLDFLTSRTFEILGEAFEPSLVDVVLKLDDRRARLLGLYPSNGSGGNPADQLLGMMADRFKEQLELDRPILRPDGPIPANPIL